METRGLTQDGNGESGDGNEGSSGNRNGDGIETRDGIGDGKGDEIREGRGREGELWYPHQERRRMEDQALPFLTRYHFCRQEVVPVGSQ